MKIVYVIGAGFSRPVGIPVMAEFLEFSRRIYDRQPNEYKNFREIFTLLHRLHSIKEYVAQDLTNIETILSILEMGRLTRPDIASTEYKEFIKQVVLYYSPKESLDNHEIHNALKEIWKIAGNNSFVVSPLIPYYAWLCAILGVEYEQSSSTFTLVSNPLIDSISILTLNYDLLVETAINNLIVITKSKSRGFEAELHKRLAALQVIHLHGDIKNDIIPPIWTKNLSPESSEKWRLASKALNAANIVHFLGYSLPETDGYFRYFLAVSLMENLRLEKIKVICRDNPKGAVKERYDAMFSPINGSKYAFQGGEISQYLMSHTSCLHLYEAEMTTGVKQGWHIHRDNLTAILTR